MCESVCLEMLEGLEDRSTPLQGGVVRQAWNIATPPGEKRAALRSYPGSREGGD